jgi:hypothetical protein
MESDPLDPDPMVSAVWEGLATALCNWRRGLRQRSSPDLAEFSRPRAVLVAVWPESKLGRRGTRWKARVGELVAREGHRAAAHGAVAPASNRRGGKARGGGKGRLGSSPWSGAPLEHRHQRGVVERHHIGAPEPGTTAARGRGRARYGSEGKEW